MKSKKLMLVALLITCLLTMSAVSATSDNNKTLASDTDGDTITTTHENTNIGGGENDNSKTILKETQKTTTGEGEPEPEEDDQDGYDVTTNTVENYDDNRDTNFINISTPNNADKNNRIIITKEVEEGNEAPELFNSTLDDGFWSDDNKTETEDKTIYHLSISDLNNFDDHFNGGFIALNFRVTDSTKETVFQKTIEFYEEDGNLIAKEENEEWEEGPDEVDVTEDPITRNPEDEGYNDYFAWIHIPEGIDKGKVIVTSGEYELFKNETPSDDIENNQFWFRDDDGKLVCHLNIGNLTNLDNLKTLDIVKFAFFNDEDHEEFSKEYTIFFEDDNKIIFSEGGGLDIYIPNIITNMGGQTIAEFNKLRNGNFKLYYWISEDDIREISDYDDWGDRIAIWVHDLDEEFLVSGNDIHINLTFTPNGGSEVFIADEKVVSVHNMRIFENEMLHYDDDVIEIVAELGTPIKVNVTSDGHELFNGELDDSYFNDWPPRIGYYLKLKDLKGITSGKYSITAEFYSKDGDGWKLNDTMSAEISADFSKINPDEIDYTDETTPLVSVYCWDDYEKVTIAVISEEGGEGYEEFEYDYEEYFIKIIETYDIQDEDKGKLIEFKKGNFSAEFTTKANYLGKHNIIVYSNNNVIIGPYSANILNIVDNSEFRINNEISSLFDDLKIYIPTGKDGTTLEINITKEDGELVASNKYTIESSDCGDYKAFNIITDLGIIQEGEYNIIIQNVTNPEDPQKILETPIDIPKVLDENEKTFIDNPDFEYIFKLVLPNNLENPGNITIYEGETILLLECNLNTLDGEKPARWDTDYWDKLWYYYVTLNNLTTPLNLGEHELRVIYNYNATVSIEKVFTINVMNSVDIEVSNAYNINDKNYNYINLTVNSDEYCGEYCLTIDGEPYETTTVESDDGDIINPNVNFKLNKLSEGTHTYKITCKYEDDGEEVEKTIKEGSFYLGTNVVIPDNIDEFFENGVLKEDAPDNLVFSGNFNNLSLTINKPVNITGDNAVFNNSTLNITADNVKVSNIKFVADETFDKTALISTTGKNTTIENNTMTITGNTKATGIFAENATITVNNNNITTAGNNTMVLNNTNGTINNNTLKVGNNINGSASISQTGCNVTIDNGTSKPDTPVNPPENPQPQPQPSQPTKPPAKESENSIPAKQIKITTPKTPKKISKKAKKLTIRVKLKVKGKLAKNKKVIIIIKGKTYKKRTNRKGIAKLTLKKAKLRKILRKIKVGKKLTYKVKYGKKTIKRSIKVKK